MEVGVGCRKGLGWRFRVEAVVWMALGEGGIRGG